MEQYFQDVVSSLSLDDMNVLGALFDQDATAGFKAVQNIDVQQKAKLTEATFRKVLYRLIANKFINVVTLTRQHSLYITSYGVEALKKSLEEVSA
jgi:RIO-like serine/threonine protein kinase